MNTTLSNGSQANAVPEIRRTKPGLSLALLLTGTLLVGFSMGRWLAPLAAWIGPVLILRYARDHKGWRGYPLVIAAYSLAFLIGFGENWASRLPLVAVPIFAVFYGLLWSLPYLADRLVGAPLKGFSSTLVYPLAATTIEFLNIHTNPVGMWGATGFTQYGNLPLMQIASVTGMIGITFLMGWFAAVANWAWENQGRRAGMLKGLAVFGTVFAAVFIFGFLRLNLTSASETVRVAGITTSSATVLGKVFAETPDRATVRLAVQAHRDAYFGETAREAQAGAKVIVWPEVSGVGYAADDAAFITRAQEVARENEIYLIIPRFMYPDNPDTGQLVENTLLLIDPTGTIAINHVKYGGHIMEGYRIQGDGKLQAVDTPFGVLSGVICYDMDYPAVIQQAGQLGVGLMLAPSSDGQAIDPVHSQMAVFSAIENGMSLVRQADQGLSLAVDPYGRVLAQTDFFGSTDRTMVAQVPTRHVATLYTAFGRWFEWLCLAGFLVVVVRALVVRRQVG